MTLRRYLNDIKTNKGGKQFLTLCNNYLTLASIISRVVRFVMVVVNLHIVARLVSAEDVLGMMGRMAGIEGSDLNSSFSSDSSSFPRDIDFFPRVILCNYQVRHVSRVHDYVVQCSLEHDSAICVLALVGLWFSILAILNFWELVGYVCYAMLLPCIGDGVRSAFDVDRNVEQRNRDEFSKMLGRDGVLIAELVGEESSGAVVAKMMEEACRESQEKGAPEYNEQGEI